MKKFHTYRSDILPHCRAFLNYKINISILTSLYVHVIILTLSIGVNETSYVLYVLKYRKCISTCMYFKFVYLLNFKPHLVENDEIKHSQGLIYVGLMEWPSFWFVLYTDMHGVCNVQIEILVYLSNLQSCSVHNPLPLSEHYKGVNVFPVNQPCVIGTS